MVCGFALALDDVTLVVHRVHRQLPDAYCNGTGSFDNRPMVSTQPSDSSADHVGADEPATGKPSADSAGWQAGAKQTHE